MIFFLYGADTYRSRRKLEEIKQKYLREIDPAGLNVVRLDGEKAQLKELSEALSGASLLAKKQLVIIEDLLANKSESVLKFFSEHLKKKKTGKEDNIIVFWDRVGAGEKLNKAKTEVFKLLSKQKFSQEFAPLSNTATIAWVKKEVESRGGAISQPAAAALSGLVGNDLWLLNNEIDKLVNFKTGNKLKLGETAAGLRIETGDVENLVAGIYNEKIFALTDAIGSRNKAGALAILEAEIEGGNAAEYILAMIARQFKIMLAARQALDNGTSPRRIGVDLKLHPFVAQKTVLQVRNFSLAALKSILDQILKIDYLNKSGQADALVSLDLFIARL